MALPREVSAWPNSARSTIPAAMAHCLVHKRLVAAVRGRGLGAMTRGAFIVLEGLDRAGKSTQVSLLTQELKKRNVPVERGGFPDRSTSIGSIINDYLAKKIELAPEAVHLLFSANRWECARGIREKLEAGTTLVVDRYAASGAAYSAATTGRPLDWCRAPDRGLPAPDLVLYLDVAAEAQQQRANWGEERFERAETQMKVRQNFQELSEPKTWISLDAGQEKDEIHGKIMDKVLDVLQLCQSERTKPIKALYE